VAFVECLSATTSRESCHALCWRGGILKKKEFIELKTNLIQRIKPEDYIYAHSQIVYILMDTIRSDYKWLAFVATPYNIDGIYKITDPTLGMLKYFMRAHILTIGLFCMDSFSPETLYPMFESEGIELNKVKKKNFTKGKINVFYEGKEKLIKSYPVRSCTSLGALRVVFVRI